MILLMRFKKITEEEQVGSRLQKIICETQRKIDLNLYNFFQSKLVDLIKINDNRLETELINNNISQTWVHVGIQLKGACWDKPPGRKSVI